jgi:hypothetical protein
VAVTAYSLDIFPDQAAEAAAMINLFRVVAGFIVNYFRTPLNPHPPPFLLPGVLVPSHQWLIVELQWATSLGAKASFGTQGAICFAAFLLVVCVQVFGRRWRERFPPPKDLKKD